ncbi:MAG: ribonuclease HI, partial [bacterium]|nr:ribonuclease HI [bacterium]
MAKITIYCDGSSIGNPGPGGWGAVVMYHDSESQANDVLIKVVELGGAEKHTTNNRMELMAAIESLKFVALLRRSTSNFNIDIHTDSSYLIKGITKWIHGWQKNNWQTSTKIDVLNRDLWEELIKLSKTKDVSWHHVKGHSGVMLNERADEIANNLARGEKIKFFHGTKEMYTTLREGIPKKTGGKGKAHSYVSLVSGKIMTHKTWDECEARVKGESGAKFKKAR